MDFEPLALDTCKASKRAYFQNGSGQNGSLYQNSPLNHLMKVPTFQILYRAKDPDVEIRVNNIGTQCNTSKNDINLQRICNLMWWWP